MKSEVNDLIQNRKLIMVALLKFGAGFLIIGSVLFISVETIKYYNAWLFMISAAVPMIFELIYLINNDPELLQKRLKAKEKERKQKKVVNLSLVFMTSTFIIPGFDYRYGWSHVPLGVVAAGVLLFEAGYFIFSVVLKQNSYASRTVEIQENQKVIDYGIYSIVRHPMYLSIILIDISIPLILGSYYAVIPMILCCTEIIPRIKNEEVVLKKGLEGYEEYMKKVRYRLIPHIW